MSSPGSLRWGPDLRMPASALQNAGHALETQSGVPIVGSRVADLAGGVVATAGDVHAGAVQATAAVHVLAVVIGLAVAFVSVPVLAAYLWFRFSRSRALRGLRRLLAGPGDVDPALVALLAHRAVLCLPYDRSVDQRRSVGRPHRRPPSRARRHRTWSGSAWHRRRNGRPRTARPSGPPGTFVSSGAGAPASR